MKIMRTTEQDQIDNEVVFINGTITYHVTMVGDTIHIQRFDRNIRNDNVLTITPYWTSHISIK